MAHFCGFIKLIFLLLILAQIPFRETRPIKSATSISNDDDLIVGSEFLQLFLERDRLQNELYNKGHFRPKNNTTNSRMNSSASNSSNNSSSKKTRTIRQPHDDVFLQEERSLSSRSLRDESSNSHQALESSLKQRHQHQHLEQQSAETRKKEKELIGANNNKQVIKLVTTGSKIVFLEDYDNDDAIIDAEARDIDLQKENPINKKQIIKTNTTRAATTKNLDDFKVVAVSVSTSTQHDRKPIPKIHDRLNHNSVIATDKKHLMTIANQSTATTGHTSSQSSPLSPSSPSSLLKSGKADVPGVDNFINRSIKEIESSSHNEHRTRRPVRILQRQYNINGQNGKLNGMDAENSASTNVKKVLVIPRSLNKNSYSTLRNVTTNNRNKINNRTTKSNKSDIAIVSGEAITVEDQLLPFETVIYHDSKESHGPQSRSISYSSISQNVQDLQKWQQTGVLAEARRNVSESLKAIARKSNSAPSLPLDQQQQQQQPIETPNRYSEPSIMYSVPAKFYSEPAKIYSEPSKVYGEQEKFYSEPAKNYGEPSKFYSEPSKVYSQPAKVYSEPAKTYWPPSAAPLTLNKANDGSSLPITAAASPSASSSTANRKPAIVSRIAFGEAQNLGTLSTTSTTIRPATTTIPIKTISTTINPPNTYKTQRNNDHSNNPNNRQRYYPSGSGGGNSSGNSSPTTIPRRILFNLDKLPYDLLNAPEPVNLQQQYHHHQQQQQQQQEQHSPINPCLDAAVSSLFSTSSLSAHLDDQQQQSQHPQQQQQQQQHHSTQNTKGLLKEDLVKCVAEISHTTSTSTSTSTPSYTLTFFTTERTQNDDYYAPSPEQNYETEEAVSVMTNGRAHGIQKDNTKFNNSRGNSKNDGVAVTATTSSAAANSHNFKPMRQRVRFGTNIKAVNDAYDDDNSDATIARSRATITHNHQQHQNHNEHVTGSGRRGHLTHAQSHDNNSNAKINVAHNNNPLIQAHHNDDSVVVVNHNLGIPSENYDDYVVDIIEESAGDDDGAIFKTNPNYPTAVSAPHHHIGASNSDGGGVGQLANVPHNLNDDNDDDDGNTNGDDDAKVAYVVEGRNYRKYRVEEKTDDGFIVGEYGVVNHNDGNLRGVRYTADSTINRSLIQKALLTFLKLK